MFFLLPILVLAVAVAALFIGCNIRGSLVPDIDTWIVGAATHFFDWCVQIFNWVSAPGAIKLPYTKPENPIIKAGLGATQPLAVVMWVFAFVVCAILIALGIGEYSAKKLIVNLIIAAIFIQFLPFLCGVFIDGTNILVAFFAGDMKDKVKSLNAEDIKAKSVFSTDEDTQRTMTCVIGTIILTAIAFGLLIYSIAFLARYVFLWALVVLSPIAGVCWAFPEIKEPGGEFFNALKKFWNWWEKQFFHWCILGVTLMFFAWLSLSTVVSLKDILGQMERFKCCSLTLNPFSPQIVLAAEPLLKPGETFGVPQPSPGWGTETQQMELKPGTGEVKPKVPPGWKQIVQVQDWELFDQEQEGEQIVQEKKEEGEVTFLEGILLYLTCLVFLYIGFYLGMQSGGLLANAIIGLGTSLVLGGALAATKFAGRTVGRGMMSKLAASKGIERLGTTLSKTGAMIGAGRTGIGGTLARWAGRGVTYPIRGLGAGMLSLQEMARGTIAKSVKEYKEKTPEELLAAFGKAKTDAERLQIILGAIEGGKFEDLKKALGPKFDAEVARLKEYAKGVSPGFARTILMANPQLVAKETQSDYQWKNIISKMTAEDIYKKVPRNFLATPSPDLDEFNKAMMESGSIETLKAAVRKGGQSFVKEFNKQLLNLVKQQQKTSEEILKELNPDLAAEINHHAGLRKLIYDYVDELATRP